MLASRSDPYSTRIFGGCVEGGEARLASTESTEWGGRSSSMGDVTGGTVAARSALGMIRP
jgi:hypothetical protein